MASCIVLICSLTSALKFAYTCITSTPEQSSGEFRNRVLPSEVDLSVSLPTPDVINRLTNHRDGDDEAQRAPIRVKVTNPKLIFFNEK